MSGDKLDRVTKITAILTCLSLIVGIVIGLIEIRESLTQANVTLGKANQTLDAVRVEALSNVMDILDIHNKIRIEQVKFDADRFKEKLDEVNVLLEEKTGEQIYYSETLQDFREIVAHYERLSVLIKLNYVEFKVIFDTVAFPDNFWRESRALRNTIASNWFARDKGLGDFLSGFSGLCSRYEAKRKEERENSDSMECE